MRPVEFRSTADISRRVRGLNRARHGRSERKGHSLFATAVVHLVEGHVEVWLQRFRQIVVLAALTTYDLERFAVTLHPVPHGVAAIKSAVRKTR